MNASGELSCIPASLVLAPVLLVAIPNNPDRMADDDLRLLLMAPGATAAVVAVSLRTKPEDFDHLRAFYRRVHPLGFLGAGHLERYSRP